jgi:hypothetical protein
MTILAPQKHMWNMRLYYKENIFPKEAKDTGDSHDDDDRNNNINNNSNLIIFKLRSN